MNPNPKNYGRQTPFETRDDYTLPPRKYVQSPTGFAAIPNNFEGTVFCREEPLYPFEVVELTDTDCTVKNDCDKCFKMPRSWFCIKV